MTSLEINKKIAELKGFKPGPSGNLRYTNSVSLHPASMPDNLLSIFASEDKSWAENISDAWELFEEIPGAVISKDDDNEDGRNSYYCRSATNNLSIYGATAQKAICLAWIKWKEEL